MSEELKACPFCGGEANGDGHTRYSRPLLDTRWEDGSEITEAFFVNCIKCAISNDRPGLVGGYQTRAEAIAAWNRRTPDPRIAELEEALQGFIDDLTDSGRNRGTCLSINHEGLSKRIAAARTSLERSK